MDRQVKLVKARYRYIAENEVEHIVTTITCAMDRISTLKVLVREHDGDTAFFEEVAEELYTDLKDETGISLKNFAIAPDGIVTEVYPLEGNESLIGFNFLDTSLEGNNEAKRAYELGDTILTNPFELVQGGIGMAGRAPVILDESGKERLWGLVTVTLDFDDLIDVLDFENLNGMGVDYTLSCIDSDGSARVLYYSGDPWVESVSVRFGIQNLLWEFSVGPSTGWISIRLIGFIFLVILIISVFAGFFANLVLSLRENRRREREELISRSEQAVAASEAKSSFLANMSHEIRTPINAMLGMNEMILREATSEDIRVYSMNIKAAGATLLGITNDILDFSKIEVGKIEIVPVDYDLSSVINDLVNMVRTRADNKGLLLKLDIDSSIPGQLNGDEIRIKQIITNILTNAVKYTERGSVTFKVGYEKPEEESDSILLQVSVKDTGIGIRHDDMEKIFSEFERLELERNRNIEGAGLGMSITRSLLEMMGSTLNVESTYGRGSTFSFAVKQRVVSWDPIGDHDASYEAYMSGGNRKHERFTAPDAHVLVVDDNSMNLMVFRSLVKQNAVKTDTAESGDEAVALTAGTRYDIIFLDHMMPGKDGVETLREIRADAENPNRSTPVICLTANAISGAKEEYLAAGFDDYLSKPIDPGKLEEMLLAYLPESLIEISRDEDKKEETEEKETDKTIPVIFDALEGTSINAEEGLRCSGTSEAYLAVLQIFFESMDEKAEELNRYYKDNDIKDYTIKVHALKSSARIIGAAELGEEAQSLENAGKAGDEDYIRSHHEAFIEEYMKLKEPLSAVLSDYGDDSGKVEADEELMFTVFDEIRNAAEDMDCGRLDDIYAEMADYRIPVAHRELYEKIKAALERYEYRTILDLLSEIQV